MSKSTISTFQLFEMFPTAESARIYLESRLWPDGAFCPECKSRDRIGNRKTRLTFETDNLLRGRALVVEPEPLVCVIRLKGTRRRFSINWETVYLHAAQIAADRLRIERKAARAAKKFGKR